MVTEIIIDVGLDETRVAVTEDKELVELHIERSEQEGMAGNIYRGKVCSVLPGMQAAFVDIGFERNAFLYVGDIVSELGVYEEEEESEEKVRDLNIEEVIKQGEEITVQIIKEPYGTKGPRVSTHITLPGRSLVLLPKDDHIGISRRIEEPNERERLKRIAEKFKPEGMGLIVRTAAEGIEEADFENDISFLVRLWERISQKEQIGAVPRILHKDLDIACRVTRDLFTRDVDKLVINNRQTFVKVQELTEVLSPGLKSRIEYFSKSGDIFEYYDIEPKIEKALNHKVWLKCGGYLMIDKTEALTVIDVNTGKFVGSSDLEDTVLKTNLEAAKEIAKQVRLRDIGGIIIIDFIDMYSEEHQNAVIDALKLALKKDRIKTMVSGITSLGLIEMTRKKVRKKLSSVLKVECPYCNGSGEILSPKVIARNVEREIGRMYVQKIPSGIQAEVHPEVAKALLGENDQNIEEIESKYGIRIVVKEDPKTKHYDFKLKEIDS